MQVLRGAPASAGVARGPWVVIHPRVAPVGGRIEPHQFETEISRLAHASEEAATELEALADSIAAGGHADEGEIFAAQAAMARDPAMAGSAAERIRSGDDAIGAVQAAAGALADQLRALGDELLSARAADVLDVGDRIAGRLAGEVEGGPRLQQPAIVAAADLPPSLAATLDRERLLGLVLEGGSPTAHAAILARAYGIPAVVGVDGLLRALEDADEAGSQRKTETGGAREIAIDGETGEVVVDPDPAAGERFVRRGVEAAARNARALSEAGQPPVTLDGVRMTLLANIGTPAEAERSVALGAEGVGLFRTEFLFMERGSPPSEDEQASAYREVVEAFAPHPVTIRLLDAGGDKPIPYLPIAPEANPFLGVRALRLAAARPDIFVTQLRAAFRAATPARGPAGGPAPGRVKVMAPMVADARDTSAFLALADEASSGLDAAGIERGEIDLGVMLEIPSSILVAETYFADLAFASLGTNDLLQYTLAVDRGNRELARYQDSLHPGLLRLVAAAVQAARRAGIDLSVCGEMAGDPVAALALVGLGVRQLSMASSSLAAVRRAIRAASATVLAAEAERAIDEASASAVREGFAHLHAVDPGGAVSGDER